MEALNKNFTRIVNVADNIFHGDFSTYYNLFRFTMGKTVLKNLVYL